MIKIGMFGFGCVGQGLYDIFTQTDFEAEIIKICVKNKDKQRAIPMEHFTFDKNDLLDNPEINTIVELIDDADAAFNIVKEAMQKGKNVVTANKKMIAEHLPELVELQRTHNVSLLYEAAACGSIPIIRNLAEYYDNELLYSVSGIFNGSTNYILTKVIEENLAYPDALKQAQDLGFAESNPILDVGAFDPKYKLCILAAQAYGLIIDPKDVFNYGIQQLATHDIQFAQEKKYKIKLIADVHKVSETEISLSVMPQFIPRGHYLYHVENEYNGVIVEAAFSSKQVFVGKGAGGHPTGSAVLSDISALRYGYQYEYRKMHGKKRITCTQDELFTIYMRYQTPQDLAGIYFEEVNIEHKAKDFSYLIGKVRLSNLYALRDSLDKRNIFMARIPAE
jgi:homoserine dehydrogenase